MPSHLAAWLPERPTVQRESGRPLSRLRLRGGSCLAEVALRVRRYADRNRSRRRILSCSIVHLSCRRSDRTRTMLQPLRGMPVERVCFSSFPPSSRIRGQRDTPFGDLWNRRVRPRARRLEYSARCLNKFRKRKPGSLIQSTIQSTSRTRMAGGPVCPRRVLLNPESL